MSESADNNVLVGLTGSIGAGKSTVADVFEESGIPVLRADRIARELMESDRSIIDAISAVVGASAYRDGRLDRAFMAQQIFNDREKLERINAIVHPRTIAAQGVRAQQLFDQGTRVVACEAALIFESGGEGRFDYIVVVDADRETRLRRAAERDSASLDDIRRRDDMQVPAETKVDRADFVVRNDGTLDELKRNARFIATLLKTLPPRHRLEVEDDAENDA